MRFSPCSFGLARVLYVIPMTCLLGLYATSAHAQTQTKQTVTSSPTKSDDALSEDNRAGYVTAAAVAAGVTLSNLDFSDNSHSPGGLQSGNTARRHNHVLLSGSASFVSTDSGTVTVTVLSPVEHAGNSGYVNSLKGGLDTNQGSAGTATTINGNPVAVIEPLPPAIPTPYFATSLAGTPPYGLSAVGGTNDGNAVISSGTSSTDFIAGNNTQVGSTAIAAVPEPTEWMAMSMMCISVVGLVVRAKRSSVEKTSRQTVVQQPFG